MKGTLKMHKLEKERLDEINKICDGFMKRIQKEVPESDAQMMEQVWEDIDKRMRTQHAGLQWLLNEVVYSKNIREVEKIYYEARCFEDIARFVGYKESQNREDLFKNRLPDEQCNKEKGVK